MSEQDAPPATAPSLIECPFCHAKTPPGAFCANCGRAIDSASLAASEPVEADPDVEPVAPDEPTAVEDAPPPADTAPLARRTGDPIQQASAGDGPARPATEVLESQERRPLRDYRLLAGAAIVAILISLLLNNAGIAILLSVFLIPGLALLWITDLDLFERESWGAIIGALAGGFGIGLLVGTISAWLPGAFWIEGASFYAGAAGYAARFAEAEGSPPIGWVILGGVIIPAVALIATAAVPVMIRRWP